MDGRIAQAEDTLGAARAVQEQLLKDSPENGDYEFMVGQIMDDLSLVRWQLDKKPEAIAASEQAIVHLRRVFERSPNAPGNRTALSNGYMHIAAYKQQMGKPSESAAISQERRKLWPGNADELFKVARSLAIAAEPTAEAPSQPTAEQLAERRAIAQQAIEALHEAVAAGFNKIEQLKSDPQFKVLAGNPAFTQLLEKR